MLGIKFTTHIVQDQKHGRQIHIRLRDRSSPFSWRTKPGTIKNIIAQDQGYFIFADKRFSDNKCLCKPIGNFLYGIFKTASHLASITQQSLKLRMVFLVW